MSQVASIERVRRTPLPDRAAAARIRRVVPRVASQRIEMTGTTAECTVRGMRHRRPVQVRISLAAAIALAREGLPTVVTVRES